MVCDTATVIEIAGDSVVKKVESREGEMLVLPVLKPVGAMVRETEEVTEAVAELSLVGE